MDQRLLLVGVSVASFATGAILGALVAKKRLETHYDEMANREIVKAREYYQRLHKAEDYETPEKAAQLLIREDQSPIVPDTIKTTLISYGDPIIIDDVGVAITPKDDLVVDIPDRDPTIPYIITQEEYLAGESGYNQVTLTYYAEDQQLASEGDEIVTEIDQMVGLENLTMFGTNADDPNILYIRNDRIELDIEIVRSAGSYAREVAGFDDNSLQHSDKIRRRRRRPSDD